VSASESASRARSIVSLLQEQIMIDLVDKVSHLIVSLLQRCHQSDNQNIALSFSESDYYVHLQSINLFDELVD